MDATRIGIIACRVGAAVLTVKAISGLGNFMPLFFDRHADVSGAVLGMMALTVVPGLAAILLWVFAEKICQVSLPNEPPTEPQALDGDKFIQIGTALLGLYLLVTGLVSAVTLEIAYSARPVESTVLSSAEQEARLLSWRVGYFLKFVFGAVLFLGRERVYNLLSRVRRIGTGAT